MNVLFSVLVFSLCVVGCFSSCGDNWDLTDFKTTTIKSTTAVCLDCKKKEWELASCPDGQTVSVESLRVYHDSSWLKVTSTGNLKMLFLSNIIESPCFEKYNRKTSSNSMRVEIECMNPVSQCTDVKYKLVTKCEGTPSRLPDFKDDDWDLTGFKTTTLSTYCLSCQKKEWELASCPAGQSVFVESLRVYVESGYVSVLSTGDLEMPFLSSLVRTGRFEKYNRQTSSNSMLVEIKCMNLYGKCKDVYYKLVTSCTGGDSPPAPPLPSVLLPAPPSSPPSAPSTPPSDPLSAPPSAPSSAPPSAPSSFSSHSPSSTPRLEASAAPEVVLGLGACVFAFLSRAAVLMWF